MNAITLMLAMVTIFLCTIYMHVIRSKYIMHKFLLCLTTRHIFTSRL